MVRSWCSSVSKCKAINRSATTCIMSWGFINPPGYQIKCIHHALQIFIIDLQIWFSCVFNMLSIPMFVWGDNIGSAQVDVSGLLLCHFNLFICCILAGLQRWLQLVENIFPISAYILTTMNHKISSVHKSVKECFVRCSLFSTEVVESPLSLMLCKLLISCGMET